MSSRRPLRILPSIVMAIFCGGSLWFSGNAILGDLQSRWDVGSQVAGHITSSVQFGFISGTLLFAFFTVSDHFSPRLVFFVSAVLAALSNGMILLLSESLAAVLALRFCTGFFLAGIYPVAMKIAASWYEKGLGSALGFLIGALVLGTAFPHLLSAAGQQLPWKGVIAATSIISVGGGFLVLLAVPDGPYLTVGTKFNIRAIPLIFQSKDLRAAAFGYFGHMWELYTLWAFLPAYLVAYGQQWSLDIPVSFWSFAIIAAGTAGCVVGGVLSKTVGSTPVAAAQLVASGLCCLLSPLAIAMGLPWFLGFLLFWGVVVVGDSPQFSAVVAAAAPRDLVGSALTIVNCIGFFITIISIQLVSAALTFLPAENIFVFLAIGPLLGTISLFPLLRPYSKRRRKHAT